MEVTFLLSFPPLDEHLIDHAMHAIETGLLDEDEVRGMLAEEIVRNVVVEEIHAD